jgi:hypothetical protein
MTENAVSESTSYDDEVNEEKPIINHIILEVKDNIMRLPESSVE